MIGLILKDILNLKKYMKQMAIVLAIMIIFYMQLGSLSFMYFMVTMMLSMVVITTMSYDELAKWDKYALTMPITRRDIVTAKFLLLVITNLVGLLFSLLISLVDYKLNGTELKESLIIIILAFLLGITWVSVLFPFMFKLGVERARMIMIAILFIPTFSIVALVKIFQKLSLTINEVIQVVQRNVWIIPVICLCIYVAMYYISLRIYQNKEI